MKKYNTKSTAILKILPSSPSIKPWIIERSHKLTLWCFLLLCQDCFCFLMPWLNGVHCDSNYRNNMKAQTYHNFTSTCQYMENAKRARMKELKLKHLCKKRLLKILEKIVVLLTIFILQWNWYCCTSWTSVFDANCNLHSWQMRLNLLSDCLVISFAFCNDTQRKVPKFGKGKQRI